jgi:formylmethanofuran dehydrogenase subunit E
MDGSTFFKIDIDEHWDAKARAAGLHCEVCGTPPVHEDRHEFLASGMCRACAEALGPVVTRGA